MQTSAPNTHDDLRDALRALCAQFPPEYHRQHGTDETYPEEFVEALTREGWLAAMIPEEYGGSRLGLTEASIIMEEINRSGGNAGHCHGQMYNMGTLLRHGSEAQKKRYLPGIASGELRSQSMAVTEPTTGTDTTKLKTRLGCKLFAYGRRVIGGRHFAGELFMFKGRHFDQSVILLCVGWYLAYALSLRDLNEMMAERGIGVDHSTIHRWVVHFAPRLLERFNRRTRAVTRKWHVDETYIKVRGKWMYLYRALDSAGDTVEFWFSEHRDLPAAKRFFRKALESHGRPERVVLTAARPTARRLSPAMPRTDCAIASSALRSGFASAEPIPQQPRRAGSSAYQAPGAADARFQVIRKRDCYPGWSRDDPHDAQTAGEIRLQSKSVDC